MTDDLLNGEVAIVTGSTGFGTGSEIARVFAGLGARVVVTGRNAESGEAVARSCRDRGGAAVFVRADLAREEDCARLVGGTIEAFGSLTVLVTSVVAGAEGDGPIGDVSDDTWNRNLLVDLTSFLWLCRHALPHMEAAGHGSIVNIGSKVAERGTPKRAAYTAAKGAVHALGRQMAVDYADRGIRVNTVSPGYILGKEHDDELPEDRRAWVEGMQLTRPVRTTDVAWAAAYLASSKASTVTGHTLAVDGGASIGRALTLG